MSQTKQADAAPLANLDEWEDDLKRRYPEPAEDAPTRHFVATDPDKKETQFRDYKSEARASVKEFYRLNHTQQTVDFGRAKRGEYLPLRKRQMGIWEAIDFLNTLIDDSDPDTDVPQIEHLLQTAEAIRRDGHPRWFILTGLIHDLGKISSASTASPNGRSLETRSRSAAPGRTKSSSPSSLPIAPTRSGPNTRPAPASTKKAAGWTT